MQDALSRTERMHAGGGTAVGRLFGRDHELRAASELFGDSPSRAVLLTGEPGIGKTAIWCDLLEQARDRGYFVLSAMPSGAEVQLTFAALGDLIDGLGQSALDRLAAPQRRALDVALLRAEGDPVDARAVGVALLELLRGAAAQHPILIAIDDLQWLDEPSANALSFALRRIHDEPVVVAATLRSGDEPALDLELAFGTEYVDRLELGPLTLAAIHELVVARTHTELPRPTMLALFDAAGGNPFVAGELARALERQGAGLERGELPPVPPSVRQLVSSRIDRLAPEVRDLLLAAAGLARPTVELLSRLRPDAEATLRSAADAGVIEPLGRRGEVRFTHPLHARVPYQALEPEQRRLLHARLAAVLDQSEERARHRALAAAEPDETVAAELDGAAAAAGRRGAPARAAELCMLAVRLTAPACESSRARRALAAAQWQHRAGETDGAQALAASLLDSAEADGDTRAQAMSLLAMVRADSEGVRAAIELYDEARRQPGATVSTRREIHRRLAWLRLGAGEIATAGRHARAAVACAAGRDPAAAAAAASIGGLASVIEGAPVPPQLAQAAAAPEAIAERPDQWPETAPRIVAAVSLLWAGEIEQARPPLQAALAAATERDEPWLAMHALAYLSAIETTAGNLQLGLAHARRYEDLAGGVAQGAQRAAALWPLAVALAWSGREDDARAAIAEGLALAAGSGHALYEVGCASALGLLELSLDRGPEAARALATARAWAAARGFRALGRMPILPDSVEALTMCGEFEGAARLAAEVGERAAVLAAPWALAVAHRCVGLVAECGGDHDGAITAFTLALAQHDRQPRRGDRARTELALGRSLRRAHHKRAAREALERSAGAFDEIGAELWALRARRELARIGGRAASAGGSLSETEHRIAELVAGGSTNHEVAAALHMSARTVEWNLSKIYRKLGVRGRTQLAAAFSGQSKPGDSPG